VCPKQLDRPPEKVAAQLAAIDDKRIAERAKIVLLPSVLVLTILSYLDITDSIFDAEGLRITLRWVCLSSWGGYFSFKGLSSVLPKLEPVPL